MYKTADATDSQLIYAITRGDDLAFASLYDRYRLVLFSLLQRILRNRAEAEEILQEVFSEVWLRASDFDETRGRPYTWLVKRAHSRAIDRLRSLASRERLTSELSFTLPERLYDAVDNAVNSEQSTIVKNALAQLPEEQRDIILLAYFEGFTQSEIASNLGIPLGTVKTRARAALLKLRQILRAPALEKVEKRDGQPPKAYAYF